MVPRGVSVFRKPCTPPPGFSCPGPRCPRSARCPHSPSAGSPTTTDRPPLGSPDNTYAFRYRKSGRPVTKHSVDSSNANTDSGRTMKVSVQGGTHLSLSQKVSIVLVVLAWFFCRREPRELKSSLAKTPPWRLPRFHGSLVVLLDQDSNIFVFSPE